MEIIMINTLHKRVPVIYKDRVLMPMKWAKAHRLLKLNKATLVKTKLGIVYLKLKFEPSGYNTQEVNLGIDPGSTYDSYSIVTKDFNIHYQTSFQTNRSKSNRIINRMNNKRSNKRCRRSKKSRRHQKIRIDNKTGSKLPNTINSKIERMIWIITELSKLFPISKVIVEDVRFNHYDYISDKYFSLVEVGKTKLYNFISKNCELILVTGKDTKRLRLKYFNNKDYKLQDKGTTSFYSHSIDSYVIALDNLNINESIKLRSRYQFINKHTIFIIQVDWINKRQLDKFKCRTGNRCRYFRYSRSNRIRYISHYPKLRRIRVKVDDLTRSNHIPNWRYAYQNVLLPRDQYLLDRGFEVFSYAEPTYKCYKSRYGSSIVNGQSRVNLPRGISKYSIYDWNLNRLVGYKHYDLIIN